MVVDEMANQFSTSSECSRIFPSGTKSDMSKSQLIYYVFDLLYLDGTDIRKEPLVERKELLQQIIRPNAL